MTFPNIDETIKATYDANRAHLNAIARSDTIEENRKAAIAARTKAKQEAPTERIARQD